MKWYEWLALGGVGIIALWWWLSQPDKTVEAIKKYIIPSKTLVQQEIAPPPQPRSIALEPTKQITKVIYTPPLATQITGKPTYAATVSPTLLYSGGGTVQGYTAKGQAVVPMTLSAWQVYTSLYGGKK